MYHLVLLLAAAALLCEGRNVRHDATVNNHIDLLDNMDNHIKPNAVSSQASLEKMLATLMKQPPAMRSIEAGPTVEIKCEAFAAPAPSIHWLKNDAPIYQHDLESNELVDTSPTSIARISSTLLVPRAAAAGQYTCLVAAGSVSSRTSRLVVDSAGTGELTERSKLEPLAPRILVYYKVFIDNLGTSVMLPCRARGHPRPRTMWFNQNNTRADLDPRFKVLRSGELVISPFSWKDVGDFTCRASNIFGTATIRTFIYPAMPRNKD